ncbi:unnamed protein product [Haemonchus placei]|uniref:Arginine-hydroxylase NDUFAF5, mitochondrial n=1 Tax=Haemonchus placei TaxID=6290 RepID=A0A0N4WD00_HAEPC|nr:unnamed protein product [Haemonchus placei]
MSIIVSLPYPIEIISNCNQVKIERVVCDEEKLEPFKKDQFDLLLSSLSAHWINDLPQWFCRCFEILKPDCPIIGSLLAEDSLYELRCSLQLAEMERTGGVGLHVSPFIKPQDIGSLLNKAGFDLVTLDSDEVQVGYPHMMALMYDLQLMAESHCTFSRSRTIRRDVLLAADAIYRVGQFDRSTQAAFSSHGAAHIGKTFFERKGVSKVW